MYAVEYIIHRCPIVGTMDQVKSKENKKTFFGCFMSTSLER